MKRKVLGIAAIAIAIAASAFTVPTTKASRTLTSYKWFSISAPSLNPTDAVPRSVATYLGEGTTAPTEPDCDAATHQCVSGFSSGQVNSSNQLINDSQIPQVTPERKM
ncbi:hypothetical protein AB6735_03785 [Mucilaginibacter sp. RCC_168]|uniref:hypothetical protein n=1 Tax=Mucilaginibacter sp. RCC_168 TaxID=3239221 RepID=UPI003524358E